MSFRYDRSKGFTRDFGIATSLVNEAHNNSITPTSGKYVRTSSKL